VLVRQICFLKGWGFDPAGVTAEGGPEMALGPDLKSLPIASRRSGMRLLVGLLVRQARSGRFSTGLQLACNWPATGLQLACNWPATGLQLACNWPATGLKWPATGLKWGFPTGLQPLIDRQKQQKYPYYYGIYRKSTVFSRKKPMVRKSTPDEIPRTSVAGNV
jgi:hypothetical protein